MLIEQFIENPIIEKSNSSFGNYAIRLSNATIKFFMKKKQAQEYLEQYLKYINE